MDFLISLINKLVEENESSYLSLIFCFNIILMSSFIYFMFKLILFAVEPLHSYKLIDQKGLKT